ncbi:MAG: TerD family protein [Deltaproteobacteria bacterium]|jgi:tellurium resistance protein TerZ|nr:TerD family protein [Deltaproteobacteria bacterium]
MGVNLQKGQKISLAKEGGAGLTKVVMGLGWDAVQPPQQQKKGFFKSLLGGGGSDGRVDIDLDASCGMFDENKQLVDCVWFQQLRSKDGSILHTGDNLTGEGEGDDEQIIVDLPRVPANVKYLVFTVNSFRGQTFNEVENAFCRLVDGSNQNEIAKYALSGGGNFTAMIMAKLYRHNNEWKMHAIGESTSGRTVADLVPGMTNCL